MGQIINHFLIVDMQSVPMILATSSCSNQQSPPVHRRYCSLEIGVCEKPYRCTLDKSGFGHKIFRTYMNLDLIPTIMFWDGGWAARQLWCCRSWLGIVKKIIIYFPKTGSSIHTVWIEGKMTSPHAH